MRLTISLLLLFLLCSCADKVQIDIMVIRPEDATALAVVPTVTPSPTFQPPETTIDAPPRMIDTPAIASTSGIRPFFTYDPPNAQPPPTGLSSFPPGYTPEAIPATRTPPQQVAPPMVRTTNPSTPLYIGTISPCVAYNQAGTPLFLREGGSVDRDIVGLWLPTVAAAALGRNTDGWLYLQLPDSGIGWASDELIRLEGACETLRDPAVIPLIPVDTVCRVSSATGGSADIYSAPSYSAGVIGQLPNTILIGAVERTSSGWVHVRDTLGRLPRESGDGWVFETHLNLNGECASLPIITPQTMTTLTPVPLLNTPSPDVCSIVNQSAARVNIHAGTSIDSAVVAWLNPGEAAQVIVRSPNNWFLVDFVTLEGYIDGSTAELYGDCLGIAIPGDNYDPPAVLSPDLYRDCRFVPVVENAIADIGSLRAPLDIVREYPIVRRRAGRYLILIAEGLGGWIAESVGMVRGNCERIGISSG